MGGPSKLQVGGGGYATPYHAFQDQQGYAPQCQDYDPYQMRPNSSCDQRPDVYAYQQASQCEPNSPPYGYGPNFYDHQEPLQSFVPTHMEQNDFFHAQVPNEYAPPREDSFLSSSTNDLMMQMCASIMEKMNGFEESLKKQENICSFAFQWLNKRAEEEARQGDLPSNTVMNHNSLNDMDLEGGVQVESIPYLDEEEHAPQECQEVDPRIAMNVDIDDSMTCSCDELSICVDCYEGKSSLLMEFHRKKLKELHPTNDDVVLCNTTMDEAISRDDIHVQHQSHTLENHEEGDDGKEAETTLHLGGECKETKSQGPLEEEEHEVLQEECKVGEHLAQELESLSTSQIKHSSGENTSKGIILDSTLVPFPSSCNIGKKKYHELVQSVILDLFCMLEFNVPLLVVLEPIPTYAKPSYNLCIYKEACRPYTLLIENVVEQHVNPLSLLSHEDVHTVRILSFDGD